MCTVGDEQGRASLSPEYSPRLSVVIAIQDAEASVEACVRRVLSRIDIAVEIIVVDNDPRRSVADIAFTDSRVVLFERPVGCIERARDFGASLATGTYLAFVGKTSHESPIPYADLVRSLDDSGSDLEIAEPPSDNASPLAGQRRVGITIDDEPQLLRDRSFDNKVYRRDWWDWHGMRFADGAGGQGAYLATTVYCLASIDTVPTPSCPAPRFTHPPSVPRPSLNSLLNAFVEERRCEELVHAMCNSETHSTYVQGVLNGRVWDRIVKLLSQEDSFVAGSAPIVDRIFSIVGDLVDVAPSTWFETLNDDKRWAYGLIRLGRHRFVQFSPGRRTVEDAWNLVAIDPSAAQSAYDIWAESLGLSETAAFRTVLVDVLIAGLARSANSMTVDRSVEVAAAAVQFQRKWVSRVLLGERHLRILDAAESGDVVRFREALAVLAMPAVRVVAHLGVLGALTLRIEPGDHPPGASMGKPNLLLVRRDDSSDRRSLKGVHLSDGSSYFRLAVGRLGRSTAWDVMTFEPGDGDPIGTHVVTLMGALPPHPRAGAAYLSTSASAPGELTLHVKPSLVRRISHRLLGQNRR